MESWLDRGIARDKKTNFLWDPESNFQFGDWLDHIAPPSKPGDGRTDPILVANVFLIQVTSLMSSISSILSEPGKASRYSSALRALIAEFQNEYISPNGRIVGDSQTALALALRFSLFAWESQVNTAASRLSHIVRKAGFCIATGFARTPNIPYTLTQTGQSQLFYRMLLHEICPSRL